MSNSKTYFSQLKKNNAKYSEHLARNREYYRKIKDDATKLERHRLNSRKYARKKRIINHLENKGINIMYLLFAGNDVKDDTQTKGGANDLVATHFLFRKAVNAARKLDNTWWHIYSLPDEKIVLDSAEDEKYDKKIVVS